MAWLVIVVRCSYVSAPIELMADGPGCDDEDRTKDHENADADKSFHVRFPLYCEIEHLPCVCQNATCQTGGALLSSHRLSIRVSPDLERRIRQRARIAGRRPSAVVRDVLEQHFTDQDASLSCYDLAREAGVIGCAANAPPDLSTNPQYFDGFGGR